MELNISGIKCDNCSYRDDSVQWAQYKEWINKPCPHCSANLLTQKDYDRCVKTYQAVEIYNKIANVLKWFNPFHYWRLLTGKKQDLYSVKVIYQNEGNKLEINKVEE